MAVYATKYLFVALVVYLFSAATVFGNGVDPPGSTPVRRWRAPFLPRQATPSQGLSENSNKVPQATPSQRYARQDRPSPHVKARQASPSRRYASRQAAPSPHHARQNVPSPHVEPRQAAPSQHHRRTPSSQHDDDPQTEPPQHLKGRQERPSPHLAARQAVPSKRYPAKRDDGHTDGAPKPSQTTGKRSLAEQEIIMTGANSRLNFCPSGLSACPILSVPGVLPITLVDWENIDYECVDFTADLRSCGGCSSMDPGKHDCRTLPHVLAVSCVGGECVITSCQPGYNLQADGQTCSRS